MWIKKDGADSANYLGVEFPPSTNPAALGCFDVPQDAWVNKLRFEAFTILDPRQAEAFAEMMDSYDGELEAMHQAGNLYGIHAEVWALVQAAKSETVH